MVEDAIGPDYDFRSMGNKGDKDVDNEYNVNEDVGNENEVGEERGINEDNVDEYEVDREHVNMEDNHEEPPNKEAQEFYDLLTSANQPLYEGASESKLSVCVKLMACKTNWNVPQKCIDFFANMLLEVCPSKDSLPKNFYQVKKLVSMLGLKSGFEVWTWSSNPLLLNLSIIKMLQKIVAWRPEDEFELKSIFKSKGSKRLSEILMDARKKQERPSWMGEGAWKGLKIKWETPEYKVKAARNKKNRASAKGGSVHTGGSISINEHIIRMRRELGREPTLDEVFLRTHTKKKDSSWVDDRSKKTYETFQEKLKHASQVGETSNSGPKEVDSATRLNFWAEAAGGKTRGCLYGAGDLSKHYKPGVSSLITQQSRVSTCSGQVSAEIAAQMATIEERANATEEDARVVREECRKANKRTQDLERQLRELAESVASIKGDKRRRRHSDYDDDSDSDDDSIGSI